VKLTDFKKRPNIIIKDFASLDFKLTSPPEEKTVYKKHKGWYADAVDQFGREYYLLWENDPGISK
jgi:hypothetical protein